MKALSLALTLGLLFGGSGDVKKVLHDAERVKKSRKKLSSAARVKIEKALGEKIGSRTIMYEARAMVPMISPFEKTKVYVTFVNAKGPKGTVRLGVAVVPVDRIIARIGVLKNGDDAFVQSAGFLDPFQDYEYGDAILKPASALDEARKKAAQGKDKEPALLLRTIDEMRKVGDLWDTILDKLPDLDASVVADIDALIRQVELIEGFTKRIPFYRDTQQSRFDKLMRTMRRSLRGLRSKVSDGEFDPARKAAVRISSQSCSRCHASSQRTFSARRDRHSIGDGFFRAGYDVGRAPAGKEKVVDAVLKAIRKAVLILDQAK